MEHVSAASGAPGHSALDLAVRAGDLFLSAGMSANDVVVTIRRIAGAYGLTGVHVDVTYTAISASYQPAPEIPPVTYTRVVRPGDVDYSQVRSMFRLSRDIQHGLDLAEATEVFERICSARHPYPAWVATAGAAGVGAGVVLLFTTSWKLILATFLIGCLVDRVLGWLERRRVPPFFQQLVGAVLITMVAAGITAAGSHGITFLARLNPTLVVVGGIVMLLAGTVIVGAAQDAIDQFYVTASARVFEVIMRTAGIVLGIVIAIHLALRLGVPLSISANPVRLGPLAAQFAGATIIAAFFALFSYADAATIGFAAAVGCVGWGGYAAVINGGSGEVPASTVGALVAALAATVLTRRSSVPGFALVSAAILAFVPGLSLYDGLLQVVGTQSRGGAPAQGAATLFTALGVALGIAAGASLGTNAGRPLADQVQRARTRTRRPGR